MIGLLVPLILALQWVSSSSSGFNNSILKTPAWGTHSCNISEESCDSLSATEKSACQICDEKGHCNVHVAVVLPKNESYVVNIKRANETLQKAREAVKHILPENTNVEYRFYDDKCEQEKASSAIIESFEWCAHVTIGPICDYALASVGRFAKYVGYAGTPLISPGGFSDDFVKKKNKSTDEMYMVINAGSVDFHSYAEFLFLIMNRYNWTKFVCMYNKNAQIEVAGENTCSLFQQSLINELGQIDYVVGDLLQLGINYTEFLKTKVGVDYGIILSCTSFTELRKIVIEAAKLNMMDKQEYAILHFELYNNAVKPDIPWYDANDTDENNNLAKKGFQYVYTFTPYQETHFDWVKNQSYRGSIFLSGLYDGILMYAQALSSALEMDEENGTVLPNQYVRGCDMLKLMMGHTYQGENEKIIMNCNAQRVAKYALLNTNSDGVYEVVGVYSTENKTVEIWNLTRSLPPDTPLCGYDLSKCPTYNPVNILLISLISVIIFGLLVVSIILYRHIKLKRDIYSNAWKVNYDEIVFFPNKARSSFQSTASLRADIDGYSMAGDKQLYAPVGFYKSIRVAVKHLQDVKISLSHTELYELKVMKDLSNDNLVKFYGACLDIPNCILTEYCPRGSLQDIIENDQYKLDWPFRISLIMDLVRGMHYLHGSPIKSHGALKSSNCLVDSRFVLKIADFGLQFLRIYSAEDDLDEKSHQFWRKQLWTAPELLRMSNPPPGGTQKGDVYSFAIIMHEIITRQGVFYLGENQHMEPKEIVEVLRKGAEANHGLALRPSQSSETVCDDDITGLMNKCWSEDIYERPDFASLKAKLRQMNKRENEMNLLDNLLTRMEQYANNLEQLVDERTADYLDEKRKCEELLYQLLPKSVASQLIMGESVLAETFDSVTIYFSDIVGFTALSATSTPLQVVDLLNDLYTCFDSIIENFDVYKVETIGDAYMVVSGLPQRNGQRHAFEIARMSLALLDEVQKFKIRHRPNEPLQLRIGLHSGPCVAGVVGLKMPRYCLFGDTVNTASRMESTGLPLRIHVSPATKGILDVVGLFNLECRGEVEMKGKGKITTYWLNGEMEGNRYLDADQPELLTPDNYPAGRANTPLPFGMFQEKPNNGRVVLLSDISHEDDDVFLDDTQHVKKVLTRQETKPKINLDTKTMNNFIGKENPRNIETLREQEVPLLSITSASFDSNA